MDRIRLPKPAGHSVLAFSFRANRLANELARQLARGGKPGTPVVWTHGDSEALVQPARTRVALQPGLLLVDLVIDTDQTGTADLVIALRVGASARDATLVAVTEETPRGNALLAARWGAIAQNEVWDALLRVGQVQLRRRENTAQRVVAGLFANARSLTFLATRAVSAAEIAQYFQRLPPKSPPIDFGKLVVPPLAPTRAPRNKANAARRKKRVAPKS